MSHSGRQLVLTGPMTNRLTARSQRFPLRLITELAFRSFGQVGLSHGLRLACLLPVCFRSSRACRDIGIKDRVVLVETGCGALGLDTELREGP
jgi:hypothetical protein